MDIDLTPILVLAVFGGVIIGLTVWLAPIALIAWILSGSWLGLTYWEAALSFGVLWTVLNLWVHLNLWFRK